MKKSITVDVRMIENSGIGTYLQNLLPLIVKQLPTIKFYLLGPKEKLQKYEWFHGDNIENIDDDTPIYSLKEQIALKSKIPKQTTLFWSPHYNIPLFWKGKMLVTVHDLFHLTMLKNSEVDKKIYAKIMFQQVKRKANEILTVSTFTKNELVRELNVQKDRVSVIYNGVEKSWFDIHEASHLKTRDYLIYVGNVKPHKNLKNLIAAFEMLKDNIHHDLYIVGKKDGFITADHDVARKAQALEGRVHFTGFVDNDTLKKLISNANALVFPSLYEGFGLPPIEAMASGCPTIVSNRASIPEICGNATIYFDPESPKDISEKIMELLNNGDYRHELKVKGIERARAFSWDESAYNTVNIINKLLEK